MKLSLLLLPLIFISTTLFSADETTLLEDYKTKILPELKKYEKWNPIKVNGYEVGFHSYIQNEYSENAIVIVPGKGEPAYKYRELVYDLLDENHSIYVVEHFSQGLSQRNDSENKLHVTSYEKQLYQPFEKLMAEILKNHKKLNLIAHSMGGHIATEYAFTNSDKINRLFLSAPMYQIKTMGIPLFAVRGLLWTLIKSGKERSFAIGQGEYTFNDDKESSVTNSGARHKFKNMIYLTEEGTLVQGATNSWVYNTIKANSEIQKRKENIDIPVVLFQAGDEKLVQNKPQKKLCKRLPNCELVIFKDARHEVLMEVDAIRNEAIDMIKKAL